MVISRIWFVLMKNLNYTLKISQEFVGCKTRGVCSICSLANFLGACRLCPESIQLLPQAIVSKVKQKLKSIPTLLEPREF